MVTTWQRNFKAGQHLGSMAKVLLALSQVYRELSVKSRVQMFRNFVVFVRKEMKVEAKGNWLLKRLGY